MFRFFHCHSSPRKPLVGAKRAYILDIGAVACFGVLVRSELIWDLVAYIIHCIGSYDAAGCFYGSKGPAQGETIFGKYSHMVWLKISLGVSLPNTCRARARFLMRSF